MDQMYQNWAELNIEGYQRGLSSQSRQPGNKITDTGLPEMFLLGASDIFIVPWISEGIVINVVEVE